MFLNTDLTASTGYTIEPKYWSDTTGKVKQSASNKENIDEFRNTLILMVQDMYHKRYPYKSSFHG